MSNTGWLFGAQMVRMAVGLLVGVWVARYLGPEQFGLLNYAMAFVAMFGTIASLGLNGVVVRDLVKDPEAAPVTLGSAFILQTIGGLLTFFLAITAVSFARPDDTLAKLTVAVLGFAMVFKSTEVVKYWFESQVQSKFTVWIEGAAFLLFALVKIALILGQASLMAFVWAGFAEGALVAAGLLGIYAWHGGPLSSWLLNYRRAKILLKDSWPLILSGLAVMVYMRIDQIMLGQMLDNEAVGLYSAAVRISEVWYFVPTAISASVFPAIIEAKKQSESLYYERFQKLYDLMTWLALGVAVSMTIMSDWLVGLVYGEGYIGAGAVLALHAWTGLFVFMGVASGRWYLSENLQKLAFTRTLSGALINVLANLLLIPEFGIQGAAIGTLLSQIAAAYLFDFFHPKTRAVFWMKSKSFVPFHRYKV